jgi:rare lipoprotein A (peptidoglycan hydrolase)
LSKKAVFAALCLVAFVVPANAGGWETVHRYVHKTGRCAFGREVLASFYGTGRITANGERFNPHGLTAASYDYEFGTTITVINPHNGRTCLVRVNDRGPNGLARSMGARIDFALGARDCLGMVASQYVCAPEVQVVSAPARIAVARRYERAAVVAVKSYEPASIFAAKRNERTPVVAVKTYPRTPIVTATRHDWAPVFAAKRYERARVIAVKRLTHMHVYLARTPARSKPLSFVERSYKRDAQGWGLWTVGARQKKSARSWQRANTQ